MKKIAIALLATTLLSSAACADNSNVVATYNDGKVTSNQVLEHFKSMLDMQPENKDKKFSELDKNLQELLVKAYVNQKLLEKEANNSGLRNSEEFKKKIKAAEDQILQQELIEKNLKAVVTDKMVDEEYNKIVKSLTGQKEIKTSHILVETKEQAQEIKTKLDKGSKFEDLAKSYSKDEASKVNGGEIGYVMKGQLVPEFEAKAFSMNKGQVSEPVNTQFGWHIIKVTDSRNVKIPTKEQAINNIKGKLSREAIEKYVNDLAAKANLELKI